MPGPDDFDVEQSTPTELVPDIPDSNPKISQADIDHQAVVAQGLRLAALEGRLAGLEKDLDAHRFHRQWRRLRKYLAIWLKE